MPGSISDTYDPEFSTQANADNVRATMQSVVDIITNRLGPQLRNIVTVVHERPGSQKFTLSLTEKQLRVIRFGLLRAKQSI